ncbi:FAD-binding protein [Halosolutus halophilus]|uniref:FAD-binding protein n=1 Tax=Halosolutus halophilus TaxID=1552990 RepID=UPI00223520B2|nr:FAD-binding protein [Halosolutus halophilus]
MAKFPVIADWEELAERMEDDQIGTGRARVADLYEACLDRGVDFETDAPVEELIVDDGAVVGLVAEVEGEETAVEAASVVIAAGGIEWDEELCEHFLASPMDVPTSMAQNRRWHQDGHGDRRQARQRERSLVVSCRPRPRRKLGGYETETEAGLARTVTAAGTVRRVADARSGSRATEMNGTVIRIAIESRERDRVAASQLPYERGSPRTC